MKEIDKSSMLAITSEFSGVELGDERRAKRLRKIVGRVALRPAASLPETMTSSSELEGTYRFLNSDAFGLQDIIRGHVQATSERARAYDQVLVVHDWTQFGLSSKRKGMGPLASSDEVHGFLSNVSFCVGLGLACKRGLERTRAKKCVLPQAKQRRSFGEEESGMQTRFWMA